MFLPGSFSRALADIDDTDWQELLDRHDFWSSRFYTVDAEHDGLAFHIIMGHGRLATGRNRITGRAHDFEAVPIPSKVFADPHLAKLAEQWTAMHERNCGGGYISKLGLYVIRAKGRLGYHVDGPVFRKGRKVDLSDKLMQHVLMSAHASRRTVLPLRFNPADRFLVCSERVPLERGTLFEFSNMIPHAYFNRGPKHAALLVTTYLVESAMPRRGEASAGRSLRAWSSDDARERNRSRSRTARRRRSPK